MGRAPCCEKVGLKRGRWTAEEDEILTKYIQANGEGSWRSLPKNAGTSHLNFYKLIYQDLFFSFTYCTLYSLSSFTKSMYLFN